MYDRLYNLRSFQTEFKILMESSIKNTFKQLREESDVSLVVDWNYMLSCASILADSNKGAHQDAALRIAQSCLSNNNTEDNQKLAGSVILHKLTNDPALKLALSRNYLPNDFKKKIPLFLKIEQIQRDIAHTVYSKKGDLIYLNKFQKVFYEKAYKGNHVSASAPTSSGKSFILDLFVLDKLSDSRSTKIIYLVPTRALINQVERDFLGMFKQHNMNVYISSIPEIYNEIGQSRPCLFVFTQERLHWFLNKNPDFITDFLVVDEAQKIGDGSRGILLQQKIEDLLLKSPQAKILFCSASTENPEILLKNLPSASEVTSIVGDYISVNQNLIWVYQTQGKPKEWNINLCYNEEDIFLGKINFEKSLISERFKLPIFAKILGAKEGGNMIYVNTQDDAEKTASILYDILGAESENGDIEIEELIDLTKTLVHSKYELARVLKRGIAFHYGNMPLTLKDEIEKLFMNGKIKYLICTSTLLEGVNLPAKSIFMKNPGRGRGNPMSADDFWNLAGRAGRATKEFEGNIICIDPYDWKPPRERKKYKITKAITEISKNKDALLNYIKTRKSRKNYNEEFEYALTYYYTYFLKDQSLSKLQLDEDFLKELTEEFTSIKDEVEIPNEIIVRNPGINPLSQQSLLEYFRSYSEDFSKLVPVFPDGNNDASDYYRRIINIINKTISLDFNNPGLNHYRAILIVNWMRGYPLGRIIDSNYKYYEGKKSLNAVIRSTMSDIEEYVRFRFAKYSSCYTDILKFYLETEKKELLDKVPDLNMWIEFGVSQQTQVSLITIGLSRHTSIELSKYAPSKNLTRNEVVKWLLETDISILKIHKTIKSEILRVKKDLERTNIS